MEKYRPVIALTIGDPNGIGPEVVLKCLAMEELYHAVRPIVVGSKSVLEDHAKIVGSQASFVEYDGKEAGVNGRDIVVEDPSADDSFAVRYGLLDPRAATIAMSAVDRAIELCTSKNVAAMVTAPLSKIAVTEAGYRFSGHTSYIAEKIEASSYTMMMIADEMKVGLVTSHIPLSDVSASLSTDLISERIQNVTDALVTDFGIEHPRVAVLGLNPHAGDGGILGEEEQTRIEPAIDAARSSGIHVEGPFSADGFFGIQTYRDYDAVLAMYHDQGLIPFKTVAFEHGVNYTAGLPIVRTSPDHGTAFNLAGTGQASPTSMKHAILLAAGIAERRSQLQDN